MSAKNHMRFLQEKYPAAFRADAKPMLELDCGEGWFEIVETLCAILSDMNLRRVDTKAHLLCAKEKFGALQVLVSRRDPEAHEWIRYAELESTRTCEICGGKGTLVYRDGWQRTRCEMHSTVVRLAEDE
ncbi:hypothetical protein [Pseudomonas sp. 58 R 12]|nr:hypothetical protein [Pseudomonas sp. 58 R 12]